MTTNPIDLKSQLLHGNRPTHSFGVFDRMTEMEKLVSDREKMEIMKTFQTSLVTRQELFRTLDSVKNNDVVQTILDVILDDGFSHDVKCDLFDIAYLSGDEEDREADEMITEELNLDMKALHFQEVIENILDDSIFYGEQFIRHSVEEGKGIVQFHDNVVVEDTMAVCKINRPDFYLEKKGSRIYSRSTDEITQVCIGPRKIRMKVEDKFLTGTRRLDEYMRIGRSVIYPALDKIKQLQTLELADLADTIKKIIAPVLVSVGVPANASPQDLTEITEKYEKVLSDAFANLVGIDNLDIQTVVSMLTNVRVVPSFTDGKGAISTLDITNDDKNTLERINADRSAIANATGVPDYYLSLTGATGGSKLETLKVYSRYSRKLLVLQDSIAEAIRDIIILHYRKKTGVILTRENLKINFKSIVSVEALDYMEYAVAAVQTLNDVYSTISTIAESSHLNVVVNQEALLNLVNKFMETIEGVDNLLIPNDKTEVTVRKIA